MGTIWRSARHGARRLYSLAHAAAVGAKIGRGVVIMPGATISREHGGTIAIGACSEIYRGAMLLSYGGFIRLGERCSVNPYSVLYGHGGLVIGNDVRIAAHCVVIPANHGILRNGMPIARQPMQRQGIRIGNDVWLGAGARILDGSVIGNGCVVAAGAVVRGELEPNGIYGGVPARLLGWRKLATCQHMSVLHDRDRAESPEALAAS
ncbi:MAG TPA: acyltransferase [Rhizomicrobium sp.]|nr:acyltransferase [Rhizomicrobium sp.]